MYDKIIISVEAMNKLNSELTKPWDTKPKPINGYTIQTSKNVFSVISYKV